jgi:hypothetical protein
MMAAAGVFLFFLSMPWNLHALTLLLNGSFNGSFRGSFNCPCNGSFDRLLSWLREQKTKLYGVVYEDNDKEELTLTDMKRDCEDPPPLLHLMAPIQTWHAIKKTRDTWRISLEIACGFNRGTLCLQLVQIVALPCLLRMQAVEYLSR